MQGEKQTMKDLTSSVYTFKDLIQGNFLYVDKTEYIWQLIRPAKAMYFLSRPRRFGKSLTLSTLKAVFEGKNCSKVWQFTTSPTTGSRIR